MNEKEQSILESAVKAGNVWWVPQGMPSRKVVSITDRDGEPGANFTNGEYVAIYASQLDEFFTAVCLDQTAD